MPNFIFSTPMNYFIITGASRGFGLAIAEALCSPGNQVLNISRNVPDSTMNERITNFNFDLTKTNGIRELMMRVFSKIDLNSASSVHLINNAATIDPAGSFLKAEDSQIMTSYSLNIIAATLITKCFVEFSRSVAIRQIVNISSGAASRAIQGWATYCSSKAALKMFYDCLALELANDVVISSYDPGKIDTEMQAQIRRLDPREFPEVRKFINVKDEGQLPTPKEAADRFVRRYFAQHLDE
jgi:benzil reductase ((S)-benzoin forming)